MLRSSLLLLAVSAVAVAAPVPKPGKAQLLVVITDAKSGTSQLVLVDDDGGNPTPLTDAKSNASYPAWSPDGKTIAFSSDRAKQGVMQVFAMDADGKNVRQLTSGEEDARVPCFSPDGKKVAYCRRTPTGSDVVVADPDGKATDVLGEGNAWDPTFSPDGKTIAFVSYRDGGGFKLFRMDADGKNATKLTADGNTYGFGYPTFSPDGKTIAFAHQVGDALELHAVGADGKGLKKLTDFGGMSVYPAFSPDGKRLAFVQYKSGGKAEVLVADADGKNPKAVLKDLAPVEGGRPAWRPK